MLTTRRALARVDCGAARLEIQHSTGHMPCVIFYIPRTSEAFCILCIRGIFLQSSICFGLADSRTRPLYLSKPPPRGKFRPAAVAVEVGVAAVTFRSFRVGYDLASRTFPRIRRPGYFAFSMAYLIDHRSYTVLLPVACIKLHELSPSPPWLTRSACSVIRSSIPPHRAALLADFEYVLRKTCLSCFILHPSSSVCICEAGPARVARSTSGGTSGVCPGHRVRPFLVMRWSGQPQNYKYRTRNSTSTS